MIIRRRHTANFTTIGNALFDDERLAADEVGVLAYLLSRPDNWEVRRPALARRWDIGRDTIKRILLNLIRCGWIVARKTRLSNGTFHVVYEVRDDPGPELTADEARAATSLVSSGAGPGEDAGEDGTEDQTPSADVPKAGADPPTENPSWSVENQHPTTGLPATAGQHPQTRHGALKKESINPDSTTTDHETIDSSREPLISKEAQKLADDCVIALGFEAQHPPIELAGLPYQTSIMLARGYDPPRVVAAFARFAGQQPIKPLSYFVKVVETACTAPPLAAPSTENPNGRDETIRNGFVGGSRERQHRGSNRSAKEQRWAQAWDNVEDRLGLT